ncbi:MAG: peptide deformylase [Legionellaceae bacterium]|nr:peptide deformylase [Legionellaceae bacterium]
MPMPVRRIMPFQTVIAQYSKQVMNPSYVPSTPIDTLCARLTAVSFLQEQHPHTTEQAIAFLKKTSMHPDADLSRLQQFSTQLISLNVLEFCSTYTNSIGPHIEYKLSYTTKDNGKQVEHSHARYQMEESLCRFVSKTAPLIRIIGDPILHKPGIPFPENPTETELQELHRQIEHAKAVLIAMSGAGIAANQCTGIAAPYNFAIVGVFHDSAEHVRGVSKRYPGVKFAEATVMLNASIEHSSAEMFRFNHGCLSIPCGNRFEVESPMTMSVAYLDPRDHMNPVRITKNAVDAAILWHELAHILKGKTYIDITLEAFLLMDLNHFKMMVAEELQKRATEDTPIPNLGVPPFYLTVKVNDAGVPRLDQKVFRDVLPNINDETLTGFLFQANCLLEQRQNKLGLSGSKAAFHQPEKPADKQEKGPASFSSTSFSSKL